MKFSIIHPTARLTQACSHPWWIAMTSAFDGCIDPRQVEYILVVHHSRRARYELSARYWQRAPFGRITIVTNYDRDCLVDQCNAGAKAASGEIIMGNQDDMEYPEHWDSEILKLIPDTSQAICIQARTDGQREDLLTIPTIITRPLFLQHGAISPEYDGMFSDNESSVKFRKFGKVIKSDLYFRHLHPVFKLSEMDEVYARENREEAYRQGFATFKRREALGFPYVPMEGFEQPEGIARRRAWPTDIDEWMQDSIAGIEGVRQAGEFDVPPSSPAPARRQRVIAICTPGENHHYEWENEYVRLIFALLTQGWIVRTHFGYTTNVFNTRMDMTTMVLKDAQTEDGGAPDYVLWIDDDNWPNAAAVNELLSTLEAHSEFAIAAAHCWIKMRDEQNPGKFGWMASCGNFKPGTCYLLPTGLRELYADNASPKQVEWTGFPTLLMRFSALKQLGPEAFRPVFVEGTRYGFTGEDVAFCLKAKEAGLKIAVCPRAKVAHVKFQEIEPDYIVGPNADPSRAEAIEVDRGRRNGGRVEVSHEVKALMEAMM